MLEQVLRHLNNWFLVEIHEGTFAVENGALRPFSIPINISASAALCLMTVCINIRRLTLRMKPLPERCGCWLFRRL